MRALIGSSWGFFATQDVTDDRRAGPGEQAAAIAAASAEVPGPPLTLADVPMPQTHWETPFAEDPFVGVVVGEGRPAHRRDADDRSRCTASPWPRRRLMFWDTQKWFVSSAGPPDLASTSSSAGGGMEATAVGERRPSAAPTRSRAASTGRAATRLVRRIDLPGNAARVGEEAVALSQRPTVPPAPPTSSSSASSSPCRSTSRSATPSSSTASSAGRRRSRARPSSTCPSSGRFRYGSDLMNITADATLPGALGTLRLRRRGHAGRSGVDIVRDGIWVGVLVGPGLGRASPASPPGGMVRGRRLRPPADGAHDQRRACCPADSSLEEMIADTDDGLYMDTNRSWSIDDKRLNFQFGCEIGWEIKGGSSAGCCATRPTPGSRPQFWASLDRLGGRRRVGRLGNAQLRQGPARPGRPHRPPGRAGPVPGRAGRGAGVSERRPEELCAACSSSSGRRQRRR